MDVLQGRDWLSLHWRRLGLEKCKEFCRQLEESVAYTVRCVEQRDAGISLTRHGDLLYLVLLRRVLSSLRDGGVMLG